MTRVKRPTSTIVTAAGEQRAQRKFMQMLPFIVGVFIFVGVITGGQTLMTSTVEEKSSRVVEVLLAAVSPFQLMAGKLLGQSAVGLLAMAIYLGLGLLALYSFAMFGIIDPMLIVYFLVFFLITYLVFGALMMSIGAAVNQIQEAQSLMGPVMLLLLVPYMLSPMIGSAPNSHAQRGGQLHPADEHHRHDDADGVRLAAARVAGVADACWWASAAPARPSGSRRRCSRSAC